MALSASLKIFCLVMLSGIQLGQPQIDGSLFFHFVSALGIVNKLAG